MEEYPEEEHELPISSMSMGDTQKIFASVCPMCHSINADEYGYNIQHCKECGRLYMLLGERSLRYYED